MIRPLPPAATTSRHIDWMATARAAGAARARARRRARADDVAACSTSPRRWRSAPRTGARPTSPRASRWPSATSRRGAATGSACSAFGRQRARGSCARARVAWACSALLAELRREPSDGAGATSLGYRAGQRRGARPPARAGRDRLRLPRRARLGRAAAALRARATACWRWRSSTRASSSWSAPATLAGRPRDGPSGARGHAQARASATAFAEAAAAAERDEVRSALRRAGADHVELSHRRATGCASSPATCAAARPRLRAGAARRAAVRNRNEARMPHDAGRRASPSHSCSPGSSSSPLALLAYWSLQRRRQRESARVGQPRARPRPDDRAASGGGAICRRSCCCWRCARSVLALARPQRTVAAPQRAANIVMVTDISGSMNATDVQPNRSRGGGRPRPRR